MPKSGPSTLTPVQLADQQRLKKLVKLSPGVQAQVASDLDKTPGFVSQIVTGHRPLSIEVAAAFAFRLGKSLNEISPTLAELGARIANTVHKATNEPMVPTPFPYSMADWDLVPPATQRPIIAAVIAAIDDAKESVPRGRRLSKTKSKM